jgi:exodeoxyribonuclease-1
MNFAFFDLETTGISPAFDHPLQFAAILTDAEFREIERVDLRCRLAPHVIPSPQALAVTGVRPHQLLDPEFPSLFEFAQELTALVSRWSPAIWTGFNSIRFDEEMLRQMFYQNLQTEIFATQFNGNTRFDIMTAVFAAFHRHSDLFDWPVDETGKVRFKLDRLAPLNGFEGHNAHDALGDVEATIHIARLIAQRAPSLWAELLANRDKSHVQARLEQFAPIELVGRFGGGLPQGIIGCLCGSARQNPNQAFFFDVDAADPGDLISATVEDLTAAIEAQPSLIRFITVNKVPLLLDPVSVTDEQHRRVRLIAEAPEFRERVAAVMAVRKEARPAAELPPLVEKQIFNGFYSWSDKSLLKEFQAADWPRRQEIVASFGDARLRQLGRRLVANYAPALLSEEERGQFAVWRRERWHAPEQAEPEWTTFMKARQAISEIKASASYDPASIEEIEAFLSGLEAAVAEEGAIKR